MVLISSVFLPLAIAFIMFSLGLNLKLSDFTRIFIQPKDILVGLFSQVFILPIIAFCLIIFIFPNIPPELAIGVMVIAAVPVYLHLICLHLYQKDMFHYLFH